MKVLIPFIKGSLSFKCLTELRAIPRLAARKQLHSRLLTISPSCHIVSSTMSLAPSQGLNPSTSLSNITNSAPTKSCGDTDARYAPLLVTVSLPAIRRRAVHVWVSQSTSALIVLTGQYYYVRESENKTGTITSVTAYHEVLSRRMGTGDADTADHCTIDERGSGPIAAIDEQWIPQSRDQVWFSQIDLENSVNRAVSWFIPYVLRFTLMSLPRSAAG